MPSQGSSFLKQYNKLSNPNSSYYQSAYRNMSRQLSSASPTVASLLGIQMAMGTSYKGSLQAAQRQRRGTEARIGDAVQQGVGQLYQNSQGQANQALQGAQNAYQYEDSQPGVLDYLAGPLATIAGTALGGPLGGAIGSQLGGLLGGGQQNQLQPIQQQQFNQPNNNMNDIWSRI